MHVKGLLHTLLDKSCFFIDKRIKRALFEAADTLAHCKKLSIVALGRSLKRQAKIKHKIKCMDRLFGNQTLHKKRIIFYRGMVFHLLRDNKRPAIIIDWSGLTRCGAYHFLSASIAVGGRTLTVYEQAYEAKEYNKLKTNRQFLTTLKNILPGNCRPIVITDAGFRNTWFKLINKMGWDYVGRVRHITHYRRCKESTWNPVKTLYSSAKKRASYVGEVYLSRTNSLRCYFYLMRQEKKYRVKRNLAGKKIACSVSKRHEKRENEPWLITSSISSKEMSALEIMLLYKKRMQIEESFRDLKNMRHGFSLRHCRSFEVNRLNIALLVATLGMFVLRILGVATKQRNEHYTYQTNTEKRRNVLSNFLIGWQVLMEGKLRFVKKELIEALKQISFSTHLESIC